MKSIDGITVQEDDATALCTISNFSEQLKGLIREQLSNVWNGFAEVEEDPEIHSYNRTLESFLERYSSKTEETQKGMIGELLAHILINNMFLHMQSLSVLRNKEERSIKKGFDIVYHAAKTDSIWYTEVKSGRRETGSETSTEYNTILLNRSQSGITSMFEDKRQSLWQSALIDVKLIIENKKRRKDLRTLLDNDSPHHRPVGKRNVILVSVLYHCPTEPVNFQSILDFYDGTVAKGVHEAVIVFSIQKKTFEKIAAFLQSEYATS